VDAPDLIKLDGQLAVIDYTRNDLATRSAIDRCPTGAIVWFDDPNHSSKGASARKVLRQEALPHNAAAGV
jgi:hypothetical protein